MAVAQLFSLGYMRTLRVFSFAFGCISMVKAFEDFFRLGFLYLVAWERESCVCRPNPALELTGVGRFVLTPAEGLSIVVGS